MADHQPQTNTCRIRLFGALHIETTASVITLTSSKARSLLAYLLLHPYTTCTRDALADMLWPDAPPERVRRYLSDTLYRLRQALGNDWLEIDNQRVALSNRLQLQVDVWEFERLSANDDQTSLQQAVALYRDDLLPDIYDDWILVPRLALHEKYLTCLLQLGAVLEPDDPSAAITCYQRLVQADPLHEAARCGLIRAHARLGDYRAALQQYDQFAHWLKAELQSEPLPTTVALAATIRAEYQAMLNAMQAPLTFVGRQAERTCLLRLLEQAQQGQGRLVLVEGAPGIGKTRLLDMLAESARWRGLTVVGGRAHELHAVMPYAPLDQAFQAALDGSRADLLRTHLSPVSRAALAALAPRLHPGMDLQFGAPLNMSSALIEAWRVLTARSPHLLILDDMQWAGAACWVALEFMARLHTLPLLVVLAYRPAELQNVPTAWQALCHLDRDLAPTRLQLRGLSLSECNDLVQSLGYTLTSDQVGALHHATDGNPLYLQEALTTIGTPSAVALSHQALPLNTLLQQRLHSLSQPARAMLEIAAVLGREVAHSVWQHMGGDAVASALPELTALRFIRETADGYEFQHDLTRSQTYQAIPLDRLRQLHGQAAGVLAAAAADPAIVAWHWAQAEQWAQAVHCYHLAGTSTLQAYDYRAALQHFNQALTLLADHHSGGGDDASLRLTLLCRRMHVLGIVGPVSALRADVDAIEQLATATDDQAALLAALEARLALLSVDSQTETMQTTAIRALALARQCADRSAEARLLCAYNLYRVLIAAVHPLTVLAELEWAVELAGAVRDNATLVSALCTLAFVQRLVGHTNDAHTSASRALALTEMYPELAPARANALKMLAEVALNRSEWEVARTTMRTAITLLAELNDRVNLGIAYFMYTAITGAMGQHAEAQATARMLQDLLRSGQIPTDSHWALYVSACMMETHTQAGDLDVAEQIAHSAHELVERSQDVQATIYLLTALGSLRLSQNRPHTALRYLSRAVRLWQQTPSVILSTPLLHAIAAYLTGNQAVAQQSVELVEQARLDNDVTYYDVLYFFSRFLVYGSLDDLHTARTEVQHQAAMFQDVRLRTDFLHQVQLHRLVEMLWHMRPLALTLRSAASLCGQLARFYQAARQRQGQPQVSDAQHMQRVSLVRADAPLGRSLSDADYVRVTWTVAAPEDEQLPSAHERRRHVLQRLLAEAIIQGGAPTDADLATALGVSRRTILRDMEHLAHTGIDLPTRGRRG